MTLRLVGRAKTKMTVKMQHGSSVFRNRFSFFDAPESSWTLFEDTQPNCTDTPQSWHFKAQIPRTCSPSAIAADTTHHQSLSFLPLNHQAVADLTIPDVFHYTKQSSWSGTTLFCYVEYYLEAELRTPKSKIYTATLPLLVYSPISQDAMQVSSINFQTTLNPFFVRMLPPTMEGAPPSFKPKSKAFWTRSKLDEVQYCLHIYCPTRLQLGSRIPLLLHVAPSEATTDSAAHAPPLKIRLDSLKLTIKSTTIGICKGTWSPKKETMTQKYVIESKFLMPTEGEPVHIPAAQGARSLDLGELLDLVLQDDGVAILGSKKHKAFKPKLAPDLATFCITHTHELVWDLRIEVCGSSQFHKTQVSTGFQLCGPSRQTMDQAISELGDEERQAKFKAVATGASLGLEALSVTSDIIQAFSV